MKDRWLRYVLLFQAAYYFITALWPIIHLESFLAFVGPRPDRFVFWTVDLLILVIAITIVFGVIRGDMWTSAFLGALAAAAFITVEVIFYGQISPWFLVDFLIQSVILVAIIALSLLTLIHKRRSEAN